MNRLKSYLTAATIAFTGCGGISEENETNANNFNTDTTEDNQPDAGTDINPRDAGINTTTPEDTDTTTDSETPEIQYLTRERLAHELKEEILGYPDTPDQPCTPTAIDIQPDTPLCRSVNFLQERGLEPNYSPSNEFLPTISQTNAAVWRSLAQGLQWTPLTVNCITSFSDYSANTWYNARAGALCAKGINIGQPDGTLSTNGNATIQYWNNLKSQINDYMQSTTTRADAAEITGHILLKLTPNGDEDITCDSTKFTDVPSDTLTCYYVEQLAGLGILATAQNEYSPDSQVNMAELSKLYSETLDLTPECTGCTGFSCNTWYTGYTDTICETGWQFPKDPANGATRLYAYQMAWHLMQQ
jgi:hypothetical protein